MRRALALAGVLAVVALAGCIAPAQPADLAPAASEPSAATPAFPAMDLADCIEGGGHSVYDMALLQGLMPEPWMLVDVTEDTGPVSLGNTVPPMPTPGPVSGIYHAAFTCASFALDGEEQGPLSGGFVGIRVEPPPFDTGGAQRHYLVVTFATDNAQVNEAIKAAGLHVADAAVTVERLGPLFHTVLDDVEHGVYEVHYEPIEAGPKWEGTVRIWIQLGAGHHGEFQSQAHDEVIRPVALDLVDAGGVHLHARDASAVFSHTRTNDHDQDLGGGVVIPVPGVAGNTAGLGYQGFQRSIRLGPNPGVGLAEAWDHV
jgi:hypothetical protein